jgi:hypothetical protein
VRVKRTVNGINVRREDIKKYTVKKESALQMLENVRRRFKD